jgi:hypothetical protein
MGKKGSCAMLGADNRFCGSQTSRTETQLAELQAAQLVPNDQLIE